MVVAKGDKKHEKAKQLISDAEKKSSIDRRKEKKRNNQGRDEKGHGPFAVSKKTERCPGKKGARVAFPR